MKNSNNAVGTECGVSSTHTQNLNKYISEKINKLNLKCFGICNS